MLKLRLRRIGRKHDPSFRVVVTESSAPARGKYLESVGSYNSRLKQLNLDKERIKYWLGNGAQPTDVVHNILVREGVIEGKKIAVHSNKPSKKVKEEAPEEAPAAKSEEAPEASSSEEAPAVETEEAPKEATDSSSEAEEKQEKEEAPAEEDKSEEEKPAEEEKKEEESEEPEDNKKESEDNKPEEEKAE